MHEEIDVIFTGERLFCIGFQCLNKRNLLSILNVGFGGNVDSEPPEMPF